MRMAVFLAAIFAAGLSFAFSVPKVVVDPNADTPVRIAADAFARMYERITLVRPVVCGKAEGKGPFVRIAASPGAFSGKTDAYRIKSVDDGLTLTGANGRSAIYAVYDFFRVRCACSYFWDFDRVPRMDKIDLSGLDIFEQSRFEYRGCQYFAHRGTKRFQCEMWDYAEWCKEIDWALKNRLNVIMLRIGIEDLFQRAFPDVVAYPDPDVTEASDAKDGYNLRTPLWGLKYRSWLRKAVMKYASDRGLMHPVEYGTMTHWFSRTPKDFLEKMKPEALPQADSHYVEPSGVIWDIRQKKWFDAYWKLTEASIDTYGYSGLMFNPGFDERVVSTNREENVRFKISVINKFNREAASRHPDAKLLLEGWDLFLSWKPEEVAALADTMDPARTVIWDFTADEDGTKAYSWIPDHNNFTKWGITNRFPYTFGMMLALNNASDIRGNYALIREREKAIRDDPMCKGYLIWPENSHTDIFAWRYFTDSCWNLSDKPVDDLLAGFCRDRYRHEPTRKRLFEAWRRVNSFASRAGWSGVFASSFDPWCKYQLDDAGAWSDLLAKTSAIVGQIPAAEIFGNLKDVEWQEMSVRRDSIDLARTTLDRLLKPACVKMLNDWHAMKKGAPAEEFVRSADRFELLMVSFADVLSLHGDYSLAETYRQMDNVRKIGNPRGEHLLFENAACSYCLSHQDEFTRGWILPLARELLALLRSRAAVRDFSPLPKLTDYREKLRASEHPIFEHASNPLERTPERYREVMEKLAGHFAESSTGR